MAGPDLEALLRRARLGLMRAGVGADDPLMREMADVLGPSEAVLTSDLPDVAPTTGDLAGRHRRHLVELRGRLTDEVDVLRRDLARAVDGTTSRAAVGSDRAALATRELRLGLVEASLALDDAALAATLLPVGTRVTFTQRAMPLLSSMMEPPPRVGTVGVVCGYRIDAPSPLLVALPGDGLAQGSRSRLWFDPERPWIYGLRADLVDVLGPGTLVGLGPNLASGYVPSHAWTDDDEDRTVMVVEAEGRLWRVESIDGVPELMGVHDDEAELTWLRRIGEAPSPSP